jgi:hypothetical protein
MDRVFTDVEDAKALILFATIIGGILALTLTWIMMPKIGGGLWPYIHIGSTMISGIIGMYAGSFIGTLMGIFDMT